MGEGEGHFYLWRETDYFKTVFNLLVSAQKVPGIARRHKITTYVLQIKTLHTKIVNLCLSILCNTQS